MLENLDIRVGSCDTTGDTDYTRGATPALDDNQQCGDTIDIDQARELLGAVHEQCNAPTIGRYVYIHLPEPGNADTQTLTLCEVKVFGLHGNNKANTLGFRLFGPQISEENQALVTIP